MGVRIGLWIYRQLVIGITKTFLKSIAPFFDNDDKLCEMLLSQNKDFFIFAWQARHVVERSFSTYGLDKAYPGFLQPELLDEYLRISVIWHRWWKLVSKEPERFRITRKRERESEGKSEAPGECMHMDRQVQTDPMTVLSMKEENEPDASQETKRLCRIVKDAMRMIELRKKERKLRESLKI